MLKIKFHGTFLLFALLLLQIYFLLDVVIFSKKSIFFWMLSKPLTLSLCILSLYSYYKEINYKTEKNPKTEVLESTSKSLILLI